MLATGGVPTIPDIPGINNNTIGVDDLYLQIKEDLELISPGDFRDMGYYWKNLGKNVIIIGGTIEGVGLAEYLAAKCINVSVLDEGDIYGQGPVGPQPQDEQKMKPYSRISYETITETGVTFITKEGEKKTLETDTIIIATSPLPNTELLKAFEGMAPEVYLVGREDKEPNTIMNAIGNGYWLAHGI